MWNTLARYLGCADDRPHDIEHGDQHNRVLRAQQTSQDPGKMWRMRDNDSTRLGQFNALVFSTECCPILKLVRVSIPVPKKRG